MCYILYTVFFQALCIWAMGPPRRPAAILPRPGAAATCRAPAVALPGNSCGLSPRKFLILPRFYKGFCRFSEFRFAGSGQLVAGCSDWKENDVWICQLNCNRKVVLRFSDQLNLVLTVCISLECEWVSEWVSEWVNDLLIDWFIDSLTHSLNQSSSQAINQWIHKSINQPINGSIKQSISQSLTLLYSMYVLE